MSVDEVVRVRAAGTEPSRRDGRRGPARAGSVRRDGRRPAAGTVRARHRGALRPRRRRCSAKAGRPTSGGCCWRGASTWSVTSAGRRRCWAAWTCRGGGPGGSARGTSTAAYLATGRASTAGRFFCVPAAALRRLGDDLVPAGRAPHRGAVPHGAELRVHDPAEGGPDRAGHPRRRSGAPAQQPGRGRDAGRRRPRRRRAPAMLVSLRRLAAERGHGRAVHRARHPAAGARARRPVRRIRWRWPTARPRSSDWLAAHGVERPWGTAAALARAGADVAWCDRAARCSPAGALEPGLEWVASTLTSASLLAQVKESTRAHLRPGGGGEVLLPARSGVDAVDRRRRGAGEHPDDAGGTGSRRRCGWCATSAPTSPGSRPPRPSSTRCGPTSSTTPCTRWRTAGRSGCRPGPTARAAWSWRSATPGSGMSPEVQLHAFDPFFTTRASGRASASAWTSPAASSRGTGARSPSTAPDGETVLRVRLPAGGPLTATMARCCSPTSSPPPPRSPPPGPARRRPRRSPTCCARADADEVEPVTAWLAGEPRQGRLGVGWRTLSRLAGATRPPRRR